MICKQATATALQSTGPALLLVTILAGCAAAPPLPSAPAPAPGPAAPTAADVDAQRRAAFSKSLDSWHGAKTAELQAKLGLPTSKTTQADGKLVYVYAKSAKVSGPAGPSNFSCVVRYLVDEKTSRVVGHQVEGC